MSELVRPGELDYSLDMSVGIFIGNLNFETERDELIKHLEQYGSIIDCEIITDRFTFRSKGFARAETESRETAEKIIRNLNGKTLGGRPLKIELYMNK